MVTAQWNQKTIASQQESYDKPRHWVEKQTHYSADTGPYSQDYIVLVVMYGCESWSVKKAERQRVPKNWCLQIAVLEKTESPLGSKEIKPANLNRNQPQILTGRTEAEGEAAVFWSPDANSQLTGKVPDAGKDLRAEEEGFREWDGWMASPMQWTCTWTNSGRCWGTGRPGMLQSVRPQSWTWLGNWTTKIQVQVESSLTITSHFLPLLLAATPLHFIAFYTQTHTHIHAH